MTKDSQTMLKMEPEVPGIPERIGTAKLTKTVFDGGDVNELWTMLRAKYAANPDDAGAVMDMSVVAQLAGLRDEGLAIQRDTLGVVRLFRTPCSGKQPRVRVLVLAAALDMGANTPIEFLLENEDVDLCTLYILPGQPPFASLPPHDVAFVAVPDSDEAAPALQEIDNMLPQWPCPVVNHPAKIRRLYRSELYKDVAAISGIFMPKTVNATRAQMLAIAEGSTPLATVLDTGAYPLIVRPHDSHAGRGLAKIETPAALQAYLQQQPEQEFFLSSFIDYSSADGLFRKYRVVFVNGKAYACHMAISAQWDIWYLNANMAESQDKRAEEQSFMTDFDGTFGQRHKQALAALAQKIGLEYFAIDCAETKDGKLFIFEGSNTMIVHNMDPPHVYPYKGPQMRKIFAAFVDMLAEKAKSAGTAK